ncbi:AfsR/SARP family transcriptional regulator [Actinomycetota bacterium Odt1-20B]
MRFGVLGPLSVWRSDGTPVRIPELKVRTLLADLLAGGGQSLAAHRLIDDLWGDALPVNPSGALHAKVSQLRRVLGDAEPGGRALVELRAPGYALAVGAEDVDSERFTALLHRARATDELPLRGELLDEALAQWRGPAFADFAEEPFARAAISRLEENRLVAQEERAETRLALGEHASLVGELADLVARHPLRERLRAAQLRALYGSGRRSEALAGYREVRALLSRELGLDPGRDLVELHQAMLEQAPELEPRRPTATAPPAPGTTPAPASGTETGATPAPAAAAEASPAPAATVAAGSAPTSVPAPDGVPPLPQLPSPLTELIGRTKAVRHVRELLAARRLVTLTGPGGVGKTRLALETARQLAEPDADTGTGAGTDTSTAEAPADEAETGPVAVCLVELSGQPHGGDPAAAETVAETVAAALGLRDDMTWGARGDAGPAGVTERLAAALSRRRLLLVLDNCEHRTGPVAELAARLLAAAPGLRILATSQEPLALAGEVVWPVPPLTPDDAARLFVARAAEAAPAFAADIDAEADAVGAICRRLDGLPLALELAATRVRALGVRELRSRLDDRFRLLATAQRGVPPRQRTLRAAIDWSWEPLDGRERAVLRRLAVHAEGCSLAAAEEVCAGGEVARDDVLDLLAALVDRSLVVVAETPYGPRYRLLESVAAYGLERLREADEEHRVRLAHARHYAALAETAQPLLHGAAQHTWLARTDAETANLRAALDTALRHDDAEGAPLALRLSCALAWYRVLRGRIGEAHRSLAAALRHAAAGPERELHARAAAWCTGLAVLAGTESDPVGSARTALERYDALAAADPLGRARARWFLGHALLGAGELSAAEALTGRALDSFRALDDRWGVAAALGDRACLALVRGELADAERHGTRSAELFEELGDPWGQVRTVHPRASRARISGDYDRAAALLRAALPRAEQLGLWPEVTGLLCGLGRIALLTGDPGEARSRHESALRLATEHGVRAGQADAELGLALGARAQGRLDVAERHLGSVLDWYREVRLDAAGALVLAELGFVAEQRGDAKTALARQVEGFAVARDTGDPRALALALEGIAGARLLGGSATAAAVLLGAAAAARASVAAPLPDAERGDVRRITAAARAALGEAEFTAAHERGAALSPESALAQEVDVPARPPVFPDEAVTVRSPEIRFP